MYFYGYRQHQPHAFVNKLNIISISAGNEAPDDYRISNEPR